MKLVSFKKKKKIGLNGTLDVAESEFEVKIAKFKAVNQIWRPKI